jgi:FtsP/CotA-like multicopper oxidase with cupredoxin domain
LQIIRFSRVVAAIVAVLFACFVHASAALADADEAVAAQGVSPNTIGMQPLVAPFPAATAAPGESPVRPREDGSVEAIPIVRGNQKTFNIVERTAPWALKPGLTVLATTYNGVVPGPVLVVDQGDRVVIDYTNDSVHPDTIHLHGIHEIPVTMEFRKRPCRKAATTSTGLPPTCPARLCITRTATKRSWIRDCTAPSSCAPHIPAPKNNTSRTISSS